MITRRQLLAGILGLTAGPSWCGPQEILAAADVIVVGAGLAGLSAAVSAREAGARRVLILEKDVMIGGHSIMSSGYFNAVDPKRQKPLGITGFAGADGEAVAAGRRRHRLPHSDAAACRILFRGA